MRHGDETLDAMDVAIGYLERSGMDVSDEWRHDANGPLLVADDDGTTILATVTLAGADPNGVPMLNVTDDDAKRMRRECLLYMAEHDGVNRVRHDAIAIAFDGTTGDGQDTRRARLRHLVGITTVTVSD